MIKVQKIAVFVLIVFLSLCYACSSSDEEYIEVSPVVMDLTVVPYPKLSCVNGGVTKSNFNVSKLLNTTTNHPINSLSYVAV